MPVAAAMKVAAEPAVTVWLNGLVVTTGAARTPMTKVCGRLVSAPPLSVPPLSFAASVMVAEPPVEAGFGVKVKVPLAATTGSTLNNAALVLPVMLKLTV